jgi:hypothetical protein
MYTHMSNHPHQGAASYGTSTHVPCTGGIQDDAWMQHGGGARRKRTMHDAHRRRRVSYAKGAWCVTHGAQRTVLYASGAWHTMRGAGHRETVHGAWCVVRGAWCVVHGARCDAQCCWDSWEPTVPDGHSAGQACVATRELH